MFKTIKKNTFTRKSRLYHYLLAVIYFIIQTLSLYIGLKQQSLTRVVIVGFWATLHMIAWFVGNSALGLFKGPVDRYINGNKFTRALAGIIPVILAASLMTAITIGQYVVPLVILNMLIGFPCIAASDALADETISRMLTDKHFGIVQYVATSIIGKGLFAVMADNITSNGGRVLCATALGYDIKEAQEKAYQLINSVGWDGGYFRTDIGFKGI